MFVAQLHFHSYGCGQFLKGAIGVKKKYIYKAMNNECLYCRIAERG